MAASFSISADSLWSLRTAVGGSLVWLLLWLVPLQDSPVMDQIARIVALAVLVLLPLYLDLIARWFGRATNPTWHVAAVRLLPFAGVAACASFLVEQGWAAALLAVPFGAFSVCAALGGLHMLVDWRGEGQSAVGAVAVGLAPMLAPVAAGALLTQRAGLQIDGFSEYTLLLTVTHFLVAGFSLFVWSGYARDFLSTAGRPGGWVAAACVPAVLVGVPLTAIGIATVPAIELAGVVLLGGGALVLGLAVLLAIPDITLTSPAKAVLLAVSSGSLAIAMFFALRHGLSFALEMNPLEPQAMLLVHGWLNAAGFALWGGLAWRRG